jgi:hypothetical protein
VIKINHIGYVVRDIKTFEASFPLMTPIKSVYDPLQNADLALYLSGDGAHVELIAPQNSTAFTWNHLGKFGDSMHHICYEGLSEQEVNEMIKGKRMLKIRGPMYAPLFERDVIFAVTRARAIIEFLL